MVDPNKNNKNQYSLNKVPQRIKHKSERIIVIFQRNNVFLWPIVSEIYPDGISKIIQNIYHIHVKIQIWFNVVFGMVK